MTAGAHLIFSLSGAIFAKKMGLSPALSQGQWGHVIIGGIITCLLPDIDHPKSFLGQRLKWISRPIAKLFGHRGITHSLFAIIVCSILLCSEWLLQTSIPVEFFHAMIVGYISHVLGDMLTPAGIPLLWPYRRRFCMPILNPSKCPKWERGFCVLVLICSLLYPVNLFEISKLITTSYTQKLWK